jgi:hypothetical protein
LLVEVELAVLAGQNLAQIEIEILASSGLDEESQSAAWLPWAEEVSTRRVPWTGR